MQNVYICFSKESGTYSRGAATGFTQDLKKKTLRDLLDKEKFSPRKLIRIIYYLNLLT